MVYSSRAAQERLARAGQHLESGGMGILKGLGALALSKMDLTITIASLQKGHHIECKDLVELLEAEDTIIMRLQGIRDHLNKPPRRSTGESFLLIWNRGISVFEPFFSRRGKNEELAETEALYKRVEQLHAGSLYADDRRVIELLISSFMRFDECLPRDLREKFYQSFTDLLALEHIIFDMPEFHPSLSLKEVVWLRETLRRKQHFYANEERIIGLLQETVEQLFTHIAELLPNTFAPSPFTIPLAYALAEPKAT